MSLNTIITSAVLAASLAAGSLVPLSTAAQAGERNHDGSGYGPRVEHYEPRGFEHHRENRYDEARGYGRDRRWDRPRKRDHTGRNIAIGAFAAILGLAIISEANRSHHNRYRD
jgi:hypothetical protein